jgi:hypothetical protein
MPLLPPQIQIRTKGNLELWNEPTDSRRSAAINCSNKEFDGAIATGHSELDPKVPSARKAGRADSVGETHFFGPNGSEHDDSSVPISPLTIYLTAIVVVLVLIELVDTGQMWVENRRILLGYVFTVNSATRSW